MIFLLWAFVSLQVALVLAATKGLEPPLPKHPHGPVHGPTNLKYCKGMLLCFEMFLTTTDLRYIVGAAANVTCPADHVPYEFVHLHTSESASFLPFSSFSAVYLTAYIRTKNNDPYTGYYLYLSKHLNQYGQYTLTSKLSDAVIASLDIPVQQSNGYANGGSIRTWNADYHQLPHIGGKWLSEICPLIVDAGLMRMATCRCVGLWFELELHLVQWTLQLLRALAYNNNAKVRQASERRVFGLCVSTFISFKEVSFTAVKHCPDSNNVRLDISLVITHQRKNTSGTSFITLSTSQDTSIPSGTIPHTEKRPMALFGGFLVRQLVAKDLDMA